MMRETISVWILGGVMAILASLGLVMASMAVDAIFYGTGLAVCAFGIIFVFVLIRQHVGTKEPAGEDRSA